MYLQASHFVSTLFNSIGRPRKIVCLLCTQKHRVPHDHVVDTLFIIGTDCFPDFRIFENRQASVAMVRISVLPLYLWVLGRCPSQYLFRSVDRKPDFNKIATGFF